VNALQRLCRALVPGGLVVDTQPVSASAVVASDGTPLGRLDMRAWARTIADIDTIFVAVVARGLFVVEDERRFRVDDGFDDGNELVENVRGWRGTTLSDSLARRIRLAGGPFTISQEIRLRLLRTAGNEPY
jgi:hypothetical protein